MLEISGVQIPFIPAGGVKGLNPQKLVNKPGTANSSSFDELFQKELDKLKFSGHAQTRMLSRDISLTDNEMQRLDTAIEKAREKGAAESLIVFSDKAFIVSIPNKTVITAVANEQMGSSVITNIDSAVFA